jgi:histidinol-phosphatase (PHP family)
VARRRQRATKVAVLPPPPGDYHVHTRFSDGEGEPAQFVERALALGLPQIGISDHLTPAILGAGGDWSLGHDCLHEYVGAVRAAAARYPGITVLLGVEADYVPGAEDELAGLLGAHRFDYVIGGLHYVDGLSFDDDAAREDPRWDDAASLYRRYYALVSRAAASGLFDVLAHLDYIMLWGRRTDADISAAEDEALAAMAAHGVAIEVNTTGTLEPQGLMHPAPDLLERACRLGIPLVFGSDAHEVDQVGWQWDAAVTLARRAGYRTSLELSSGVQKPLP